MFLTYKKNSRTKRITLAGFAALCSAGMFAFNITGSVKDSDGEPAIGASIRLLQVRDSVLIRGAVADANGRFTLDNITKGKYILELSQVGSSNIYKNITVAQDVKVGQLTFTENATLLREAKVTGIRTPIKVMEDTVEYSADTYKVQPNAVVEDLLKRLPGVEVGTDGSITANGKTVSKILIDGKEFFSDDPTVASKNLPVNMVEKLQVVDRKSDLARMTGVDDGEEETVINLTVKKGMQNGWFGNAEVGYGTDERYKGSFIVNRFWNGNQLTFLGGMNNINEPGFSDGAASRFRRFGGDNGLTRSKALGLNFNVGKDEILRVGGDVMYSNTDRRTITTQERQYLFTDSTSYLNSDKTARDKGHNVRADFRIQWKPDEYNSFDLRPNFSYNTNNSFSNDSSLTRSGRFEDVTRSRNITSSDGNSWEFGIQAIYNHKFKSRPGRAFSIMANLRTSNVKETDNASSWNKFYLLNDSIDLYDQYSSDHSWSKTFSTRVSWTEPLGDPKKGHFLNFSYRFSYRWNYADKMTYDHPVDWPFGWEGDPVVGDTLIWNESLSNSFRNRYMSQDIRAGYKYVSKTSTLDAGISLVPQKSTSIDLIDANRNLSRTTFNVAPYVRFRYKASKTRSMNLDYRGNASQPSISQLQPVADMSNPLNIVVGNPALDPTFTHNIRVRFQDFNSSAQRSIMAMVNGSVEQNSIVSKTEFDQSTGGRTTTYENVNGVWNAMGIVNFSTPFKRKSWTFNAFAMMNYRHSIGFSNGLRNAANSFNFNIRPGIAFRPTNLELDFRPTYGLQTVKNSIQASSDRTVHSYGGHFTGTYYTAFGLTLSTDLDYTATSGYSAGYDTHSWLWNATVSYRFLPGDAATVSLHAYDLLNQKSNIRRNITASYIDDTRYNSLTRYFMVSFTYKFNTFGAGNQPTDRNEHRGPGGPGMPPPPGGGGGRPPRF